MELLRHRTVLAKFGQIALRSDDLDDILSDACVLVREALGTDLAMIMDLQDDGETLLVRAGVGWKPVGAYELAVRPPSSLGGINGGMNGSAMGKLITSSDAKTKSRFNFPPFLTENGVRAVTNVVIEGSQGRPPFGVLQVNNREPRQFSDDDLTFLTSYASLIAAAVDRLRSIKDVRDERKRLRLALEIGEPGSWDFDLATGNSTQASRCHHIFGYADPLLAWSYDTFLSHVVPEDRGHVATTLRKALDTGTEWHFECRIRRAGDGKIRWIEAHGTPTNGPSAAPATHLPGTVTDITARRVTDETLHQGRETLEARVVERTRELVAAHDMLQIAADEREQVGEVLRQSNKMEAVGQLTGGLAHDFNNLLAGISGSLELIRTRAAQGRVSEIGRYVDTALTSVNRAATLTHRLLAFSARQTLDPRHTDVNQLVGGMADLFSRTLGPSIQVKVRLEGELWPTFCDQNQLESALLNLAINARDALPDGGQVIIETKNIVLLDRRGTPGDVPKSLPPGEYVVLSVMDTGTGMAPDVLARAFDPFFTTKPLGQGTGLGLSMIYGFVQQSGGQVHLRSTEGHGTTVTIFLPRDLGASNDKAASDLLASLPDATANAAVLVVEDEPLVRMVVVEALSDLGYTVMEAGDGRSGLRILESTTSIDLLLSDIGLPGGMNGRQLADAARQLRPSLKVLFMTGYAAGAVVGDDLVLHDMQVITKPFGMDALAAKVQGVISNRAGGRVPGYATH